MLRTSLCTAVIALHGAAVVRAQGSQAPTPPCPSMVEDLTLTVVYDNNPENEGLAVERGSACVVEIIRGVKEGFGAEVLLVVGGFHLRSADATTVDGIVKALHDLGVRHVAPCHRTGGTARAAFAKVFRDRCHPVHVRSRLKLADLS